MPGLVWLQRFLYSEQHLTPFDFHLPCFLYSGSYLYRLQDFLLPVSLCPILVILAGICHRCCLAINSFNGAVNGNDLSAIAPEAAVTASPTARKPPINNLLYLIKRISFRKTIYPLFSICSPFYQNTALWATAVCLRFSVSFPAMPE